MTWNNSTISALHLSCATVILFVDCCQFVPSLIYGLIIELMACANLVGSTTVQNLSLSWSYMIVSMIWTLVNCLHYTSAVPQPFLLLIAANLAYAGCLGWNWSLCPVRDWLVLQRSKYVFYLMLYDIINDMKHWWTVCITPQPCHSHFWCWLILIRPKLDFWAENGAYGLCGLGLRYNGAKLYFSWSYMILSMILNTSKLSALQLRHVTAIFVVDWCQFDPSWMFGLKTELIPCADLVGGTTEQSCLLPDLIW